jgi:predicted PurR-regulated permease PerM
MPEPTPPVSLKKPRVGVLLGFLAAFLLMLIVFREVLFPFLLAIFIAYLIEPVVVAVTKAPVFGVRWTRGPTIVVMYVFLLGGIVLASSCAVAKVTRSVKDFSGEVSKHLNEQAERATFQPAPDPAVPGSPRALEKDVLVPAGTRVVLRPHPAPSKSPREVRPAGSEERGRSQMDPLVFATLYDVVVVGSAREPATVLLKATKERVPRDPGAGGYILNPEGIRHTDGTPLPDAASWIQVGSSEPAVGLEVFVERTLVTPIVENLGKVGFQVEPVELRELISAQAKAVGQDLPDRIPAWTTMIVTRLALSVYEFILILMLTAFLVLDRKSIARFFASLPPERYRDDYLTLMGYVDRGLAGVIRGQLVICAVNGVLTYLGLVILGIQGAPVLGLLAGIFSLIPIFGTILSSIPIVLIGLADSVEKGLLSLAWIAFIHLLEANLLNPLIMGSHARMHPVVIIFALLAGEHTFGVWGALLAVPTMSIIQSCFQFYRHEIEGVPWEADKPHGVWIRNLLRRVFTRKRAPEPTPS